MRISQRDQRRRGSDGEREGKKTARDGEIGEMGGRRVEEKRREAEEAQTGGRKVKEWAISFFLSLPKVRDETETNKRRSLSIM